jgi:hypothetical protein
MDISISQQQSKKCFLCNTILDKKNDSKEHIIKNSIGGRKKVKGFICDKCNNKTGNEWDNEIDKSLGEYCSLLFQISRENGKIQSKKVIDKITEKEYFFKKEGIIEVNPSYTINEKEGTLTIQASSKDRARHFQKELVSKYKSKGIELKISDKSTYEDIVEKTKIETSMGFNIPQLDSGFSKSIVKSALALLSTSELSLLSFCNLAKSFLTKDNFMPCLDYHYAFDPITNRPFGVPLHCVRIFSHNNNIDAYVELFGIARYYINLSNSYKGGDISLIYAINPIDGHEIKTLSFDFNQESKNEVHPAILMRNLIEEKQFNDDIHRIFRDSIKYALGLNDNLTEKFSQDLSRYFTKEALDKANNRTNYINLVMHQFYILLNNFYSSIMKNNS